MEQSDEELQIIIEHVVKETQCTPTIALDYLKIFGHDASVAMSYIIMNNGEPLPEMEPDCFVENSAKELQVISGHMVTDTQCTPAIASDYLKVFGYDAGQDTAYVIMNNGRPLPS